MAQVVLKNVTKRFGSVVAVDRMNVQIADKEFLVLVGPSGCGKSTTLRMIAGLEEPTEGEIYIDDVLVNDLPPQARDIAMVFQNYALYPHLDVYQNMAFGLNLRRVPKDEIDRRVKEAARMLGVTSLLRRKPKGLSGGERQRIALGRAIVREANVFLMDEPLSNLDAKLRVQMRVELAQLHQRLQTTVVYVTHDQTEAMTMGDRIVVMADGVVQQIGTPLEIYHRPANVFVGGFIGSPAMSFIHGVIREEEGDYTLDADSFVIPLKPEHMTSVATLPAYVDRRVIVGIRPEAVLDGAGAGDDEGVIWGKAEVVEPMGSETIVYLSKGEHRFRARLAPEVQVRAGEQYPVRFDVDRLHFFDAETETRLA